MVLFDDIETTTELTPQTSACQITAILPRNPSALRKVSVAVSNTDHQMASSTNRFSYYLGELSFKRQEPPVAFPMGTSPSSVALGDLDLDGALDLAVANSTTNTVSVLLRKPDGTCGPKQDFTTGSGPASVALGDLDRDGHLDLAVTNFNDATVSVLQGKPDGAFGPKQDFPTGGGGPISIAMGDV